MKDIDNELLNSLLQGSDKVDDAEAVVFSEEDLILAPLLEEVGLITDQGIRLFTRALLLEAPESFWEAPSSITKKHHPPDEHGVAGNILHTKRVVRNVVLLSRAQQRPLLEEDIVIAAALLHDTTKFVRWQDGSLHYDRMHPYTVDDLYRAAQETQEIATSKQSKVLGSTISMCEDVVIFQILKAIRGHLGLHSPVPETIPMVTLEWILHLADNMAANLHHIIDGDEVNLKRWKI
jgi:23S rRNA maturation-related 3'-5' exoribonuclease YhaM